MSHKVHYVNLSWFCNDNTMLSIFMGYVNIV